MSLVLVTALTVLTGAGCNKGGGGGGNQPAPVTNMPVQPIPGQPIPNQPIPGQPINNNGIPNRGGPNAPTVPGTQPPVVSQPVPPVQPPVVVAIPEDQRIRAAKEILRMVDAGVPAFRELMGQNPYGEPIAIRPLSMAALLAIAESTALPSIWTRPLDAT